MSSFDLRFSKVGLLPQSDRLERSTKTGIHSHNQTSLSELPSGKIFYTPREANELIEQGPRH